MCNTEKIKVSVVMPIYNAYDYLKPAIDSVLDQTLRELELICIDDGSTDHSLDIIKEYKDKDERVRIITENNAGPSIARNKGLLRSRGEYIIFLDGDDFYEPELIETLYNAAVKDNLDIAVCCYDNYYSRRAVFEPAVRDDHSEIFAPGKVVSKNEYPDEILQSVSGYVWNKLFKRSFLIEKELRFSPEIRVFEDVYFVVTAMSLADRVERIDRVLVHHRVYSEQSKNRLFKKYYRQIPGLYAEIKEFLRANGKLVPLFQSFINLSASRCHNIYSILWADGKEEFWNLLHYEYAEGLGWAEVTAEDIERSDVRSFVTNVLSFSHEQFLRRVNRGRTDRPGGVDRAVKTVKIRNKFKKIFSVFKRKRED